MLRVLSTVELKVLTVAVVGNWVSPKEVYPAKPNFEVINHGRSDQCV